jgi:hypothetical protein
MTEQPTGEVCTHACAMGCGRKYDVIIVQVIDSSTLMLCMPCGVSFWANVAKAMVEPNDPAVMEVVAGANFDGIVTAAIPADNIMPFPQRTAPAEDEFDFDGSL